MQKALETKLSSEDMISTIFIFSDMEFDECTHEDSSSGQPAREQTNYEAAKVSNLGRLRQANKVTCSLDCGLQSTTCPIVRVQG